MSHNRIDPRLTPEQLRAQAHRCDEARYESEQRSDTDGFLSQWASNLSANLYETEASIREAGGVASFPGLYSLSQPDYRIPAILIDGQYGRCWAVIYPATRKFTGEFITAWMGERGCKKHNVMERPEMAPAHAEIIGKGKGLSGTAWVVAVREDGGWSPSCKPIADAEPYHRD